LRWPVTAIILQSLPPAMSRIRRIASWPSITGIRKSIRIRCGRHSSNSGRLPRRWSPAGSRTRRGTEAAPAIGDYLRCRRRSALGTALVQAGASGHAEVVFRLNRLGFPVFKAFVLRKTAFAHLADYRDVPAHKANKLSADGQAQSVPVPACCPVLVCSKCRNNLSWSSGDMPGPVSSISTGETAPSPLRRPPAHASRRRLAP